MTFLGTSLGTSLEDASIPMQTRHMLLLQECVRLECCTRVSVVLLRPKLMRLSCSRLVDGQMWRHSIVGREAVVVLDAPLLFESGAHLFCKHVIVVHCPEPLQMRRLAARDNCSLHFVRRCMCVCVCACVCMCMCVCVPTHELMPEPASLPPPHCSCAGV